MMPYADAEDSRKVEAQRRHRERLRETPCSHPGCDTGQDQLGLCGMHARRKRLGQEMDPPNQRPPVGDQCDFPGCDKPVRATGLCAGHWTQKGRGYELRPIYVPLTPEGRKKRNSEIQLERHYRSGGHIPKGLKVTLWNRQSGNCGICAGPLNGKLHIDHVMPIKLGGTNDVRNLQLAHATCNLAKGAKHPIEFAQARGALL